MDYRLIVKVLGDRVKNSGNGNELVSCAYKLYMHEFLINDEERTFDEAYFKELVEGTSPVIEKSYEEQDEDGSLGGDVFRTSLFAGLMCVTSRVYDDLDSIFARDCIHAGLDAAHFLMVSKLDVKALSHNEKLAMLWAFSELSRTDVEIKNAYDHSMMAGMPQKMSRQKKYKMLVNELGRELFNSETFNECADSEDITGLDLLMFSYMIIPVGSDEIFSEEIISLSRKCLFDIADSNEADKTEPAKLFAILAAEYILERDSEIENSSDAQLIKVIEYNVINQKKKKLSPEDKAELEERIVKYTKSLEI
ncbi:hypothetical protein [Butyrivibrio sp. XPD2002]|uniref:hypothetical protein n=1 Tax=Butyrivibrio sp. XPD2002 TaxID=1280665 RepID=UPI0003F66F88|nr:hypothetical protein [Butyrivibrio sp. XPD2002]